MRFFSLHSRPARRGNSIGLVLLCAAVAPAAAFARTPLRLAVVATGFAQPLAFVPDPTDARVAYVVEQGGHIRVLVNGAVAPTDFLDLSGAISTGGERGLLGLAFAPDYADSGRLFVNFTNPSGDTVIARFRRSSTNPRGADPGSRFDLEWADGRRVIPQPFANHNGGTLRFGPDGYLYIGMGDGGAGNDPLNNAQRPDTLLGKMLRIDVSVPDTDLAGYRVPPDNPFADGRPIGNSTVRPLGEIWAFGMRNPWKFCFDAPSFGGTGALFIGDVGQSAREEIDAEGPGQGGRNYGWRVREGAVAGADQSEPAAYLPLVDPVIDYGRDFGSTVTAGCVYRGRALGPEYVGRYFYADFGSGRLVSVVMTRDPETGAFQATDPVEHTSELGGSAALGNVASIDLDLAGELHLVDLSGGRILRLEAVQQDQDGDGLPDGWENWFGLDPSLRIGPDGAAGDPDNDGLTNAQELAAGTHPRGVEHQYFAEGATSAFFDTTFALTNTDVQPVHALLRFLKSDGSTASQPVVVGPQRRATVAAKSLPDLASAEFSTVVDSDRPVSVARTMTWGGAARYGAHMEKGIPAPAPTWYLAEGATHSGFSLFYLIENPNASPAPVEITYLLPAGTAPLTRQYTIAPNTRRTIWVNTEDARLASTDVSAVIRSTDGTTPVVVERAMYLDSGGHRFAAGHDAAGVTTPSASWYFAEGATGPYFDEFLLLANPSTAATATVRARFLRPDGALVVEKHYSVAPASRRTIWVDLEGAELADTAVAAVLDSTNGVPFIAERAMWWPGPSSSQWREAHVSAGATRTASTWRIGEGEAGGHDNASAYVLVANTSPASGEVRVTLEFADGPPATRTLPIGANSRVNVDVGQAFPGAAGRQFGVLVESGPSPALPLVVEESVYWDALGRRWEAGANLTGSPD